MIRWTSLLANTGLIATNFYFNDTLDELKKWPIYLTHWMLTLNLIESAITVESGIDNKNKYLLFHTKMTLNTLVVLLYWSLVYNKDNDNLTEALLSHAAPCAVCITSAYATKTPYDFRKAPTTMLLTIAYVLFSVIYLLSGGTNPDGKSYI